MNSEPGQLPDGAIFIRKPFSADVVHRRLLEILSDGLKPKPLKGKEDCTLEQVDGSRHCAVRLGLRMVKGLSTADAARIVAARTEDPFAGRVANSFG